MRDRTTMATITPGCELSGATRDVFPKCPGRKKQLQSSTAHLQRAPLSAHSMPEKMHHGGCVPNGLPCPDTVKTRGVTLSLQFVK